MDCWDERGGRLGAWWRRAGAHLWTIGPSLYLGAFSQIADGGQEWRAVIANEFGDPIERTGRFCDAAGSSKDVLVVVLHGLGGHVDRGYCQLAAAAAREAGLPCFRLAMRGADGRGTDLHHAGFVDDLPQILSRSPCEQYDKIVIVGYSLGGHVALTAGVREVDPRLAAVVAICPPLDLKATQHEIDSPSRWIYRRHLLQGLKKTYPAVFRGMRVTTAVERIMEVQSLREWDRLTVVPRFGFDDVDQYYETQSVGVRLSEMAVPTLIVASSEDPLVPAYSLRGPLSRAARTVEVRWVARGGHVFFPPSTDLGLGGRPGLEHQIMSWLVDHF